MTVDYRTVEVTASGQVSVEGKLVAQIVNRGGMQYLKRRGESRALAEVSRVKGAPGDFLAQAIASALNGAEGCAWRWEENELRNRAVELPQ